MITVLRGIKDGTRVNRYECSNGECTLTVTKEQLITYIQQGEVKNARIQNYQGRVIVRVENANVINSKEVNDYEVPTELKKLLNIEKFIRSYKDKGVEEIALGDAKVNTETLNLIINNTVSTDKDTSKKLTKLQVQDIVERQVTKYKNLVYTDNYAYFVSADQLYCLDLSSEKLSKINIEKDIEQIIYNDSDKGNMKIVMHNNKILAFRFAVRIWDIIRGTGITTTKVNIIWAELNGENIVNTGEKVLCDYYEEINRKDGYWPGYHSMNEGLKIRKINNVYAVNDQYVLINLHMQTNGFDDYTKEYYNNQYMIDAVLIFDLEENRIYNWGFQGEHNNDYIGTLITGYRHDSLELDKVDLLNVEETDEMLRLTLRNRYKDKLTKRTVSVYENDIKYTGSEDSYYTFKVNKETGKVIVKLYDKHGEELEISNVDKITYR